MTDLQFAYPWVLFLLWMPPVCGVWWYLVEQRRERRLSAFVSPLMQERLRPESPRLTTYLQILVLCLGLLLAIVAIARPRWGQREEIAYQRGRDLLIVLDVSRSMLANDVYPNRLERARIDLIDLIKELRGDRAGLLVFRHKALMACPLTTDHAFLLQALDGVSVGSAPPGETDIGDAILKALEAFEGDVGAHKAIILISDGEDLSGKAREAAEQAAGKSIPIFTVGIGNRKGGRIPGDESRAGAYVTYRGEDVVSKLDHETLYAIARTTGGAYIPVETASMTTTTLGTIYRDHLRALSARDLQETLERRYVERYQLFLLPALICLLAATCLSRGRLSRTARGMAPQQAGPPPLPGPPALKDISGRSGYVTLPLLLLCLLLTMVLPAWQAYAQTATNRSVAAAQDDVETPAYADGRKGARHAQKLFALRRYEQAAEAYLHAAATMTGPAQRNVRYNAAIALFKAGEYERAAELFRDLMLQAPAGDLPASLGLGNARYRTAKEPETGEDELPETARARLLEQAGEAFKEARRHENAGAEAERNLGVVLHQLEEAREQAHIAELLKSHEQTDAGQLVNTMLSEQRRIADAMARASTNTTPEQIEQIEAAAEALKKNADLWIPLKGKLLAAMQQTPDAQQNMGQIEQLIETTRDTMHATAGRIRDMELDSDVSMRGTEAAIYGLWKQIAPYSLLLEENLWRQTNAITSARAASLPEALTHQQEAAALTPLFIERFEQMVPENPPPETQGPTPEEMQGSTNTLIDAETRQKILELATLATSLEEDAARALGEQRIKDARADQNTAYDVLLQIRDLLPKDDQSQQQDQQQDNQDQQQDNQDQQDQPQDNPDQQDEQDPSEEPQDQQPQDEPEQGEPQDEEELSREELEQLLEKALQREREHEAEKRRRQRIQLAPHERDW